MAANMKMSLNELNVMEVSAQAKERDLCLFAHFSQDFSEDISAEYKFFETDARCYHVDDSMGFKMRLKQK